MDTYLGSEMCCSVLCVCVSECVRAGRCGWTWRVWACGGFADCQIPIHTVSLLLAGCQFILPLGIRYPLIQIINNSLLVSIRRLS